MDPLAAARQFLTALAPEVRGAFPEAESLAPRWAEWWKRAAEARPGLEVDPARFAAFVASRVRAEDAPELAALRLGDLLLVHAALEKSAPAEAELERLARGEVQREARRMRSEDVVDEASGIVLRILLVGGTEKGPALAGFSGRAELGSWLRVIAARELLRLRKAVQQKGPSGDDALSDLLAPEDDPELALLKAHYRQEFRRAVSDALRSLPERERTLLRMHFLEERSIDDIGTLYGVHRSTAARWVVRAREAVAEAAQRELLQRVRLGADELTSLVRLMDSRLELSLSPLKE